MVQTLMGLVKGKGKASDRTPELSGAGGGNPVTPQEEGQQGLEEEEETPMMKEKDLGGDKMRVGKEDGTRDLSPGQKMTLRLRLMKSWTPCPE